jgi:hypothetical protein
MGGTPQCPLKVLICREFLDRAARRGSVRTPGDVRCDAIPDNKTPDLRGFSCCESPLADSNRRPSLPWRIRSAAAGSQRVRSPCAFPAISVLRLPGATFPRRPLSLPEEARTCPQGLSPDLDRGKPLGTLRSGSPPEAVRASWLLPGREADDTGQARLCSRFLEALTGAPCGRDISFPLVECMRFGERPACRARPTCGNLHFGSVLEREPAHVEPVG